VSQDESQRKNGGNDIGSKKYTSTEKIIKDHKENRMSHKEIEEKEGGRRERCKKRDYTV